LTKPSVSLIHLLANSTTDTWAINTAARGSGRYEDLKRGTDTYDDLLATVAAANRFSLDTGSDYGVDAVVVIHGSVDRFSTEYADWLQEWRRNYSTDIGQLTASTSSVPFFITQLSRTRRLFPVHQEQLEAHVRDANINLIGPLYPYPKSDSVHLSSSGYYYTGEVIARVIEQVLVQNSRWEPLRPVRVTTAGAKIDIEYHVPTGAIQLDTQTIDPLPNYGFDVVGTAASIQSVEVINENTIQLTLTEQAGEEAKVEYYQGNVRDSETAVSELDGTPLPNWSVVFELPVSQGDYFPVGSSDLDPEIHVSGVDEPTEADRSTTLQGQTVDFGAANSANEFSVKTFSIQNLGSGTLELSGSPIIQILDPQTTDFTVTSQPSSSVSSGSSTRFDIKFDPSGTGRVSATVSIDSNDSDGVPFTFEISGTGQLDTDNDGQPDELDPDDDGDGQTDLDETTCGSDPLDSASNSTDVDRDGVLDCVDNDIQVDREETTDLENRSIYVSSSTDGVIDGIAFADEDILFHQPTTDNWSLFFDGSDVGWTSNDLGAFHIFNEGDVLPSILMSLTVDHTIPGIGRASRNDIVKFTPSVLGSETTGTFSLYLDGSTVGLNSRGESIDAIGFDPANRLVVSTTGSLRVPGTDGVNIIARDEDMIALDGDTWTLYFDGSATGLNASSEDVWGTWIADNGDVYLTTQNVFSADGLSGDGDDIFSCTPTNLGAGNTTCIFDSFWMGEDYDFDNELIDGFSLSSPSTEQNTSSSIDTLTKDIIIQLGVDGTARIAPTDIDDGSTVSSGSLGLSLDRTNFDCSHVGSNLVALTVSDGRGHAETAFANVSVEDNVKPVARARDQAALLNSNSVALISTEQIDDGSGDACGLSSLSLSKSVFSNADLGENLVWLEAVDTSGNSSSVPATITISEPSKSNAMSPVMFVSTNSSGTIEDINFSRDDILAYDVVDDSWDMLFDASDVGLVELSAFELLDEGNTEPSILMSVRIDQALEGVGPVSRNDIVKFIPTTLGDTTSGQFSSYLNGASVGLSSAGETISALSFSPSGQLLVSVDGNFNAQGTTGRDEDIFVLNEDNTWSIYLDGSDVKLTGGVEELWATWTHPSDNRIFFSTKGNYSVLESAGTGSDVVVCLPSRLGENSSCTFSSLLFGSAYLLNGGSIDGLSFLNMPEN